MTLITLLVDMGWRIYSDLIIPYLIILGPYILILMAHEIRLKANITKANSYVILLSIIILLSFFAHILMLSHHGPDYWGLSALWVYIVALVGDLVGVFLLIQSLVQYKRFKAHNKSLKTVDSLKRAP